MVLVGDDGDRTMFADRGANAAFCLDDVDLPRRSVARTCTCPDTCCWTADPGLQGWPRWRRPKTAGWTTSVDPQAAVHIPTAGAATFLSWVRGADLLLPNDAELAVLGGLGGGSWNSVGAICR